MGRTSRFSWQFALAAWAAWASAAHATEMELKFEDLPGLLKARNSGVAAGEILSRSASLRTGHLVRSSLPVIEAVGGAESFRTGNHGARTQPYGFVEARLNLFRGGRDLLEERTRQAQTELASTEAMQVFRKSLSEARKLYWRLVYEREVITVLQDALVQTDRNLLAANRRIQRGLTTETDRLDFEISRDSLRDEIESFRHESVMTQISLRALLSLPEDTEFKTAQRIPHEHDESLLKRDPDAGTYPEVAALDLSARIHQTQGARNSRWWTPTLDAYGGYYLYTLREREFTDQNLRTDAAVGLRLTLHLFDGFQSAREASAQSLHAEALGSRAAQEARLARSRLKVSQEELKHAHELIHALEERVKQSEEYYSKTLSEYDRGVKNSPDVQGALERKLAFRRRSAELRRDYQESKAAILGMVGEP